MFRKMIPIFLVLLYFAPIKAQDIVNWQNIHWPPFQILRGKDAGNGRFDHINSLIQKALPQYQHQNIEMNWARYWEEIKTGKHIINSMSIITDERSQYAVFSDIVSFSFPHRIIMKKSAITKLGLKDPVDLSIFFKHEAIKGAIEIKRSYGSNIDELIDRETSGFNIERKPIDIEQIIQMLLSNRIDYTIEYPFVVEFIMKELNMPQSLLGSIQIKGLPRFITASIAAPKNDWGMQIISEINPILDNLKKTRNYLDLHTMWHTDKKDIKEIQEIYHELFNR